MSEVWISGWYEIQLFTRRDDFMKFLSAYYELPTLSGDLVSVNFTLDQEDVLMKLTFHKERTDGRPLGPTS